MRKLRAGILGCGSIAHKHAEAALALGDQVELVAFCSRDESKAGAFAEQYTAGQGSVFTDYDAMFDQAQLDLVIICLPPFAHQDEVERAAAHGAHILIEKPIALDSEQAWRMVAAAEGAKIKTQVGFIYRFGEAVEQFKARLDGGAIGPVGLMAASYFCNSLHAPWWRDRAKSGGQLVEQLIHLFDLMRHLVGQPTYVYSRQADQFHRAVPGYSIEDVSATIVEFTNGALGVVYATNGAVPGQWVKEWRVVTSELLAEFTNWNHATFISTDAPDRPPERVNSQRNVFYSQLQDLVTAIQMDGETRTPLREGARSLDLVLAAIQSNRTHAPVTLTF